MPPSPRQYLRTPRAPQLVFRRIATQNRTRDRVVDDAVLVYLDEHNRLVAQAEELFLEWARRNAKQATDAGELELLRKMRGLFDNPENMRRIFGAIGGRVAGDVEDTFHAIVPSSPPQPGDRSFRLLNEFAGRNTLLIAAVGDVIIKRLRKALRGEARTFSELEQEFRNAAKVTENNVKFWATDQTLQLHADLTKEKHQSVGIKRYFWTDSNDERVRHRHGELGELSDIGQAFEYANPPIIDPRTGRRGNPGDDYYCRCTAFPVLE